MSNWDVVFVVCVAVLVSFIFTGWHVILSHRGTGRYDGSKRPPPLSPEVRRERAEGRDRGVLNDGSTS